MASVAAMLGHRLNKTRKRPRSGARLGMCVAGVAAMATWLLAGVSAAEPVEGPRTGRDGEALAVGGDGTDEPPAKAPADKDKPRQAKPKPTKPHKAETPKGDAPKRDAGTDTPPKQDAGADTPPERKDPPPRKVAKHEGAKPPAKRAGKRRTTRKRKERKRGNIRRMRPNRNMRVVARSLKLTEEARERLYRIARRYRRSTRRKLIITGGDRSPWKQAKLMYNKLKHGEDLLVLYARDDLVKPIIAAYEQAQGARRSRKRTINAMAAVIQEQIDGEQYVSRHLQFTAADVRSRNMSEEQFDALKQAVKEEPGVRLVDERGSTAPHLHLSLVVD